MEDKAVVQQRSISQGALASNGEKAPGSATVVNGDPTRLEAPHGISEKAVVRKW